MSADTVRPMPVQVVVDIVNGWGGRVRAESDETHSPYPDPEALEAGGADLWEDLGRPDDAALADVADRLFEVFAATSGPDTAERLNALVTESRLTTVLACHDDSTLGEEWRTSDRSRALLAAATLALVEHFRDFPDPSRLGTCDGDECLDVYVDTSPAARRRFCTVTCQNRMRARTYRAGRRAEADARAAAQRAAAEARAAALRAAGEIRGAVGRGASE
ncbi:MAG: CGNR zinc finger domain-containing protein, partial [Actinomycetaceae bacterium]